MPHGSRDSFAGQLYLLYHVNLRTLKIRGDPISEPADLMRESATVAGLAGLFLAGWLATLAQAAPNIVFIITDDQDKLVRARVALALPSRVEGGAPPARRGGARPPPTPQPPASPPAATMQIGGDWNMPKLHEYIAQEGINFTTFISNFAGAAGPVADLCPCPARGQGPHAGRWWWRWWWSVVGGRRSVVARWWLVASLALGPPPQERATCMCLPPATDGGRGTVP